MPYPNFPDKYREKSLLRAEDMLNYQKKIGLYPKIKPPLGVIFTFQPTLINYIVKNYPVKKVKFFFGDFYILKDTDSKVGICGNFGIGAPISATLLEQLTAFGIKNFISVGIAGSLQKHLQLGSIIVCDRAIRDEGTSYHYVQGEKYSFPSQILTQKIIETIKKKDLSYSIGTTWTIDAPYRETIKEVEHYKHKGVLTVDMEVSAIFAVAKYLEVEAAAIFTISDYLGENEWNKQFHLAIQHLPNLFLIAKETLNLLKS